MKHLICIISFCVFLSGCKESYVSPVNFPGLGYLVVEGTINSGPGSTTIKLSRSTRLADGTRAVESGAAVMVEDELDRTYPLTERVRGEYVADGLNLDSSLEYRLRIVANSKEYLSDYVAVNDNPPIDSISGNRAP